MAKFTTSDGLRLHVEDTGSGQPLLCLAGLTRTSRDFDFLAPHLGGMRLIAMDYRGRGLSDRAPDPASYNVTREMQDAVELLDHLGLERVTVLGTSRGGLIAMAMAAMSPGRLAGVILNDVGPEISAEGIARIMDYVGRPPVWHNLDGAAAGLAEALGAQFPGVPAERWRAMAAAQFEEAAEGLRLRYDPRLRDALTAQAAAGPPPDLWPLFDALKPLPAGVLRGANSDILTAPTLAEMRRRHSGLHVAEIPDRGHAPFLDEPQSLALIRTVLGLAA
ncbi:MAG: alpha/beta fold hydrolase [Jhaorihella sp.]